MNERWLELGLILLACLPLAACAGGQQMAPTATSPPPTLIQPTFTPQPTAQPTPTATQVVPGQPACFQTYLAPVAFTPDNGRLLVRADSGVQIVNLETQEEERFLEAPTALNGPGVALSPDGETLAWALADGAIQLVHLADEQVLNTLPGHRGPVTKLRFSPAGDRLYSASHDGWVRAWDMEGGMVGEFQPGGGEVVGLGVSTDGSMLATIPADGPLALWDTAQYQAIAELGGTGGYDTSDAAFSPDGRYVAADLATGLSVWQIEDGTLSWEGVNSMALAFSPRENLLAYADIGENNDLRFTSPDGTEKVATLSGHQAPVWEMVFSPDGSLLASADGLEIRVWRVDAGELLYIGMSECP